LPIPAEPGSSQLYNFALSPQGTSLALLVEQGIQIFNVTTGAERTWVIPVPGTRLHRGLGGYFALGAGATNEMLARTMFGVAENSQHIYGRALDVHFGSKLVEAMQAARKMQRGGVGWYPQSSFMHIDSGPVRNWDLDHTGLGTLLVGGHRVHFNKKGDLLVAKNERRVGGRMPAVLKGECPLSVRDRLVRLRQLARAEYVARRH